MFIFNVCATLGERKSKQCLIDPLECLASKKIKKLLHASLVVSELQNDQKECNTALLWFREF
jgi:hypothetical protein